jgi:acetyl-CoA carboxylase biotin carboxyl carrier protein
MSWRRAGHSARSWRPSCAVAGAGRGGRERFDIYERLYAHEPSREAQEAHLAQVEAHITGTVWKIEVDIGDSVQEGDTVVILESMKMEMPVEAEDPGVVKEILCEEGQSVSEGDPLVVLE